MVVMYALVHMFQIENTLEIVSKVLKTPENYVFGLFTC